MRRASRLLQAARAIMTARWWWWIDDDGTIVCSRTPPADRNSGPIYEENAPELLKKYADDSGVPFRVEER